MDEPAKTLKAGDHGVPGGENMMLLPDGSYRYFTVRETARLQTFPDEYVFQGSWGESMRQLGNAGPVDLAGIVAKASRPIEEAICSDAAEAKSSRRDCRSIKSEMEMLRAKSPRRLLPRKPRNVLRSISANVGELTGLLQELDTVRQPRFVFDAGNPAVLADLSLWR